MENWYVKNTEGKVFGPISLDALKSWVRDGRVEPLAGISADLKNWMLAPMKAELEMNWIVENNPGQFYGPTHQAVVEDLKKSGTLSPAARFYKDDRGKVNDRIRMLEQSVAEKDSALFSKDSALAEAQKMLSVKDGQIAEAKNAIQQRDSRIAESVALIARKDSQLDSLAKALASKESEISAKAGDYARMEAVVSQRELQILQLNEKIKSLEDALAKKSEVMPRQWEADEVLVPEIVSSEPPPPVARQAFSRMPNNATSLADLERQAQQELARMGANNAKGFFKFKR